MKRVKEHERKLCECVRIREGQLTLPGDFCDAVNDIIGFLCTECECEVLPTPEYGTTAAP